MGTWKPCTRQWHEQHFGIANRRSASAVDSDPRPCQGQWHNFTSLSETPLVRGMKMEAPGTSAVGDTANSSIFPMIKQKYVKYISNYQIFLTSQVSSNPWLQLIAAGFHTKDLDPMDHVAHLDHRPRVLEGPGVPGLGKCWKTGRLLGKEKSYFGPSNDFKTILKQFQTNFKRICYFCSPLLL